MPGTGGMMTRDTDRRETEFSTGVGADDELGVSRSEMKRRSTARQKIGEELARMPMTAVRSFGLSDEIVRAFEDYHKANRNEARRRQMQFIGKLLREADTAEIEARLNEHRDARALAAADFHHLERMRDALMEEEPGALDEVLAAYPAADMQHLRQLVRNGRKEIAAGKPPRSVRTLFRYLRELEEA